MDLTGRPKTNSFFGKSAGATLPEPVVQPTPESSNVTTILKGMRIEGLILAQEDMYVDNEVNGPITSNSKVTERIMAVLLLPYRCANCDKRCFKFRWVMRGRLPKRRRR